MAIYDLCFANQKSFAIYNLRYSAGVSRIGIVWDLSSFPLNSIRYIQGGW